MRWGLVVTFALAVIAACGGGLALDDGVINAPPTAASGPAAQASAPPSSPQVPPAPAAPAWVDVLREDWAAMPALGGYTRAGDYPPCHDPAWRPVGMPAPVVPPGAAWVPFGAPPKGLGWAQGALLIDDEQQPGQAWAIVHAQPLPHDRAVRISAVVDMHPDPGAFLGLALWDGEGDYAEIALYAPGGDLRVGWWTPCSWRDLAAAPPGARALQLVYTPPPAETCWVALVDGVQVHAEPCSARSALVGPAHLGIWAVNLDAEARRKSSGRVRASVGPVRAAIKDGM